MKSLIINETIDLGQNNKNANLGNVFFVGTDSDTVDISNDSSLQKFKKSYKDINNLSVENGFFMTSLPSYAIQYAENFASENNSKPIVLAVEFKKDIRFFDLEDPADYAAIGLDEDISEIFISAEPYFAINSLVPNRQMPYQPREFSIIKKMLGKSGGGTFDNFIKRDKTFDKINNLLQPDNFIPAYNSMYMQQVSSTFEDILGKNNPVISSKYAVKTYPDRRSFILDIQKDQIDAVEKNYIDYGKQLVHVSHKDKESETGSMNGVWNAGNNLEDGLSQYNKGQLTDYPDDIADLPLFKNYMLLFGINKDKAKAKTFGPFSQRYNKKLYDAYLKLFAAMHKFMNEPEQKNRTGKVRLGLDAINARLKQKSKLGGNGKHIYIDFIQFICFSMILEYCTKKNINDIYGVATRERIGYSAIRDNKEGYMYTQEELNSGFIQQKDRTLILCRPLSMNTDVNIIGHVVDEFKKYDPKGIIARKVFDTAGRILTIDQYKQLINTICDKVEQEKTLIFNKPKQLYISGKALKIINGNVNSEYSINFNNLEFNSYIGYTDVESVIKWLTELGKQSGYGFILKEYKIKYDNIFVSKQGLNKIINWKISNDIDSRYETNFSETPDICFRKLHAVESTAAKKLRKTTPDVEHASDAGQTYASAETAQDTAKSPDIKDTPEKSAPHQQYSAYKAEIMIDTEDGGNTYQFEFACKNGIDPKIYVDNIILSGIAKDVPSYLFQKVLSTKLKENATLHGVLQQASPFARDPQINGDNPYVISDIMQSDAQIPDIKNKDVFIPVSKDYDTVISNISKDISEILMPDGLVNVIQTWLDANKLNYRLKERKSWINIVKKLFGNVLTQQEINKLDESLLELGFLQYVDRIQRIAQENLDEALSGPDSARLRRTLKKGEVRFSYRKKSDGSVRHARGTLRKSNMPAYAEKKLPRRSRYDFTYFDLDKNDFRTFKRENFVQFDTGEENSKINAAEKDEKQSETSSRNEGRKMKIRKEEKRMTESSQETTCLDESNPSNWVLVTDISPKRAKWLVGHSRHDVRNFEPGNMVKALKMKPYANCIWGLFNRYDRNNALALMTIVRDYGPEPGCVYFHEMTGFMKGGPGRALVRQMLNVFPKIWLQCEPIIRNGRSELNDGLANGVYRKIPELKEYTVANSIWGGPANFFYCGIDDDTMAEYLEQSWSSHAE